MQFSKEGSPPATRIIRLRNGETLIATIQSIETNYMIERPMTIMSMPTTDRTGRKKIGVFLKDWIDYTNDTYFTIPKDIVLVVAEPDVKMFDDYTEAKIHSDLQKAQDDLQQIMQEYINQPQFPLKEMVEDNDMAVESGYTAQSTNEEQQDDMDEDEDDGLPWWKGNPRVRF
jgi:hypothetical protein